MANRWLKWLKKVKLLNSKTRIEERGRNIKIKEK